MTCISGTVKRESLLSQPSTSRLATDPHSILQLLGLLDQPLTRLTNGSKHTKHNHSLKITDAGSKNDHIFSKFDISAHANQYPRCNAHEQGKTSKHDDDSFEYYNNGYNRDLSTGPGLALYEEIIYELRGELSEGGPVWERTFQPHIDLIETILQRFKLESGQSVVAAALSQPLLKLKPVEVSEPPLPKPETMPLKDWMRGDRKTDIIQGWVSREDGPSQEASKELLAAVICRGWGVVTIGHVSSLFFSSSGALPSHGNTIPVFFLSFYVSRSCSPFLATSRAQMLLCATTALWEFRMAELHPFTLVQPRSRKRLRHHQRQGEKPFQAHAGSTHQGRKSIYLGTLDLRALSHLGREHSLSLLSRPPDQWTNCSDRTLSAPHLGTNP